MAAIGQGLRANRNGRAAEDVIESILWQRGLRPRRQQVVGISIYGSALRADLLLAPMPQWPAGLVIESKWQDTLGTADEKLAFLALNILEGRYPAPVVIVVHGGGRIGGWRRSGGGE